MRPVSYQLDWRAVKVHTVDWSAVKISCFRLKVDMFMTLKEVTELCLIFNLGLHKHGCLSKIQNNIRLIHP
jgi:hypothetical protein